MTILFRMIEVYYWLVYLWAMVTWAPYLFFRTLFMSTGTRNRFKINWILGKVPADREPNNLWDAVQDLNLLTSVCKGEPTCIGSMVSGGDIKAVREAEEILVKKGEKR